ncbi:hypothetical protein [Pseudobacteroides cellulosolvens]|uniref:Uncharacterized protein n=1 Tax=Pseudobacteroides cellulosolvens ATCC 35603 = DSM 2933 TaxID=398512 RepID=A0A0L6JPW4_9FIRM|nr:hypothetical protein [Pseudobacteroides cellulosolvens]KNY27823.1 hypothetical protein Bccel_3094 [Pseudobacteroides cellulosolvens ATCC 35603 = DSM 2933]
MLNKVKAIISIIATFAILFSLFPVNVQAATTLTSNATGTIDGYNYEYWKDNGTGTMTLNGAEHSVVHGVISIIYYFVPERN